MKKTFIILFLFLLASTLFAQNLVLLKVENGHHLQQLFQQTDLQIHHYNDQMVIATTQHFDSDKMILLDEDAFADNEHYFLVYCELSEQNNYISRESQHAKVLFKNDRFFIIKPLSQNLMPAKNDGMVAISNTLARLTTATTDFPIITEEDPDIRSMMNQVSIEQLTATVQHLQDFGTRRYNTPTSVQAQNWLTEQYQALGLEVSLQDFKPGMYYQSSDNVIAVQRGTLYPDEYVVCGCHYDSYTFAQTNNEPGADDNATGCAAVLETARILSQYSFERSIIYCSFSAEEIGLYGSAAFAQQCAWQDINILGYFNNDMNGYLLEGTPIHIDLIYPNSANAIGDYYKNICQIYFPEMAVNHEQFMSGDSDHTSFNNNGYVGLYPFEDHQNYSPYIHTSNDVIGLSVNNWNLSKRYTEVNLSCLATLAVLSSGNCPKAKNLSATINNQQVTLTWDAAATKSVSYEIYRNQQLLETTENTTFTETLPSDAVVTYGVKTNYDNCEAALSYVEVVQALESPELFVDNAFSIAQQPALKISVSEVAGAQQYSVYKDNGMLQATIYPFFRSVFLTNNVQLGQEYCYTAKAEGFVNGVYEESNASARVCGYTDVVCPIPNNFAGQYQNDKVSLIWTNPNYSEGCNVYRNDVLIGENIQLLYFIDNQPPQGNNCYTLRSICYNGESESTTPLCFEVVDLQEFENQISISPNPANQSISISGTPFEKVHVYNSSGQCLKSILLNKESQFSLNTTSFPSGIYLLRIELEDHHWMTKRVVVQH